MTSLRSGEPLPDGADTIFAEWVKAIGASQAEEFGIRDAAAAERVARQWYLADARLDFHAEAWREQEPAPEGPVLDLASGMGTALARGRERGIPFFGLEPDGSKTALGRRRFPAVRGRVVRGVGEALPFRPATFAAVISWQTLEHVRDPETVLAEMLRVLRPGGFLHLRCPDYRGTFEGHYLLPWLPLLPRPLARLWLRLRGRPGNGLAGIVYVTAPRLRRALRAAAGRGGFSLVIRDRQRERVRAKMHARGWPAGEAAVTLVQAARYAAALFRREWTVDWVVTRRP